MSNQIQIRISKVLELLGNGQDRDAIAVYYGITKTECKELFQHPKLKGRKVKKVKVSTFVVLDDEFETVADTPGDVDESLISLLIPDPEAAKVMDEEANQDAQAFENLQVFEDNDSSPTVGVTEEEEVSEEEVTEEEEVTSQDAPRSSWNNG
jgi:CO dehydrogenase/acetyl-CoA synthase beta subunit